MIQVVIQADSIKSVTPTFTMILSVFVPTIAVEKHTLDAKIFSDNPGNEGAVTFRPHNNLSYWHLQRFNRTDLVGFS